MADNDKAILEPLVDEAQSRLGADTKGLAFLKFVAEQALFDQDIGIDEIEAGIIDGSGDGGVDAVYVHVNGTLITDASQPLPARPPVEIVWTIVTAQYTDGFKETVVGNLRKTAADLIRMGSDTQDFGSTYNQRVLDAFKLFGDIVVRLAKQNPSITINVVFATRAPTVGIHQRVRDEAGHLEDALKEAVATSSASVQFVGARELIEMNRRVRTRTKQIKTTQLMSSESGDAFVALVTVDDFFDFLKSDAGELETTLFDANVRDFQGDNQVNKAIRHTLLEAGDNPEFWWLNNGVTIVAAAVNPRGKYLVIEDPLIVNGLQTSTVLFAFKADKQVSDGRCVLVRVIAPEGEEQREKIIRATNQQTSIPPSFLRAMDDIHRDIEEFLRPKGIYYERRKNFYRNKKLDRKNIVTIGELAQACVAGLLRRPSAARARPNSIIQSDDQYNAIFSANVDLNVYEAIIFLLRAVEDNVRTSLDTRDRNNIKYHCLAAYLRWAIGEPSVYQRVVEVRQGSLPHLPSFVNEIQRIYVQMGGSDKTAKSPEFEQKALEFGANFVPTAE